MKTYLHGPKKTKTKMDLAKTLKLRFRVGDLDLPERMKKRPISREGEKIDALMSPWGDEIQ